MKHIKRFSLSMGMLAILGVGYLMGISSSEEGNVAQAQLPPWLEITHEQGFIGSHSVVGKSKVDGCTYTIVTFRDGVAMTQNCGNVKK